MHTKSVFKKQTKVDKSLARFLHDLQSKTEHHTNDECLLIYTCHKRGGKIFHGHPNYRGGGPWKDWAIFDWGKGHGELPGHIACFVDLCTLDNAHIQHGGIDLEPGVYAVVESMEFEPAEDQPRSELFRSLRKEVVWQDEAANKISKRTYYLANTEAIVDSCCVIPDIGGPCNRYFQVEPRTEWASMFEEWLVQKHEPIEALESDEEEEIESDDSNG